ncbi:MAG: hypothetical protein R2879_14990 [Saprospiraceae bacterium]
MSSFFTRLLAVSRWPLAVGFFKRCRAGMPALPPGRTKGFWGLDEGMEMGEF